jgi:hypothetical protein
MFSLSPRKPPSFHRNWLVPDLNLREIREALVRKLNFVFAISVAQTIVLP